MMKLVKRLFVLAAIGVAVLIALAGLGVHLLNRAPAYYRTYSWSDQELSEINQRALSKITQARAELRRAWAKEVEAGRAGTASPPARAMTISFTQEELNALLMEHAADRLSGKVRNPGIFLRDGHVILAGEVKETGYLASGHFKAGVDESGRIRLTLEKAMGGRLPVPKEMLRSQLARVESEIRMRLPGWQRAAKMDANGAFNDDSVRAAMGKLAIAAIDERPGEGVLFMVDEGPMLPMRVKGIEVGDEVLSVTLEPMTLEERREFFLAISASHR